MEEKIKEIISPFIKVSSKEINLSTAVNRASVNSSIMLHRMYAKLSEQGFIVQDYSAINNFGGLLARLNGNGVKESAPQQQSIQHFQNADESKSNMNIGIDIEEISALPKTTDFREDDFYKMNFTPSEIAYCILQPDPYASFAGLFAAKEAFVKINNEYGKRNFNSISIDHSQEGKPIHDVFQLSISHTNNTAVAVAVKASVAKTVDEIGLIKKSSDNNRSNGSLILFITLLSLMLSAIALFFALQK